jgi:2-dehydropantoate 2-reductase
LSLQNGVDNEIQLASVLGSKHIMGGLAIGIGAHIISPGYIEASGHGKIITGLWPNTNNLQDPPCSAQMLKRFCKACLDANIPVQASDDIQYELWRKLIINNGVNPLSALTALDTQRLTNHSLFKPIVLGLMKETVIAAQADGIELKLDMADEMLAFMQNFDAIKTSMLVDKEKGRPLELEAICGAVLKRSQQLGVEAPFTQLVSALLSNELEDPARYLSAK